MAAQKGNDSYIAVIHIDGNRREEMVHSIINKNQTYEKAVPAMRRFLSAVAGKKREAQEAMAAVFGTIYSKYALSLSPLIMGGDDLTYLCGAEAGIASAVFYLRKLFQPSDGNLTLSACAGIAFTKNLFPLRIAYEIAEECCARAKKRWYGEKEKKDIAGYLDFHVVRWTDIKGMEVCNREETLRIRPCQVNENENLQRPDSVDRLFAILKRMKGEKGIGKVWPRNRLYHLYEAYLSGPLETETLRREYASRGYELLDLSGGCGQDAPSEDAGIFDALEALDFYKGTIWSEFWDASGVRKTKKEF